MYQFFYHFQKYITTKYKSTLLSINNPLDIPWTPPSILSSHLLLPSSKVPLLKEGKKKYLEIIRSRGEYIKKNQFRCFKVLISIFEPFSSALSLPSYTTLSTLSFLDRLIPIPLVLSSPSYITLYLVIFRPFNPHPTCPFLPVLYFPIQLVIFRPSTPSTLSFPVRPIYYPIHLVIFRPLPYPPCPFQSVLYYPIHLVIFRPSTLSTLFVPVRITTPGFF